MVLKFIFEVLERKDDGHGVGDAHAADSAEAEAVADIVADVQDSGDVVELAVAMLDPVEDGG